MLESIEKCKLSISSTKYIPSRTDFVMPLSRCPHVLHPSFRNLGLRVTLGCRCPEFETRYPNGVIILYIYYSADIWYYIYFMICDQFHLADSFLSLLGQVTNLMKVPIHQWRSTARGSKEYWSSSSSDTRTTPCNAGDGHLEGEAAALFTSFVTFAPLCSPVEGKTSQSYTM